MQSQQGCYKQLDEPNEGPLEGSCLSQPQGALKEQARSLPGSEITKPTKICNMKIKGERTKEVNMKFGSYC
jgi:hypothetical protein